jgi:hypothetical protein
VTENLVGIDGVELSDQWDATEASLLMYYLDHISVSQMVYSESIESSETALNNLIMYHLQLSDVNVTYTITNSSANVVAFFKPVIDHSN